MKQPVFLTLIISLRNFGNLLLLKGDEGKAFNMYAYFMTTNPVIKAASYILYSTFLVHIIYALLLTIKNKSARKIDYFLVNSFENSG